MTDLLTQNPALANWILAGLAATVVWFLRRTLVKIDKNQSEIFDWLTDIEKRVSFIEGAHTKKGA